MNPKATAVLITVLGVFITAIEQDYGTYRKAKAKDPTAKFEWVTFGIKMAKACLFAIPGGLGVSMAVPMGGE